MKHLCLLLFLLMSTFAFAQEKAVVEVADSVVTKDKVLISGNQGEDPKEIKTYADRFVPRKASLYAAILPGMGQIYNKKYWKLPIVYGGFIALGLTANFYAGEHKKFKGQLFDILRSDDITVSPDGLNEDRLRTIVDDARRERDYFIILTGVFYLLQIADAHIDAHLKEFQLNPDLKVTIDPMIEQSKFVNQNTGISLKLHF